MDPFSIGALIAMATSAVVQYAQGNKQLKQQKREFAANQEAAAEAAWVWLLQGESFRPMAELSDYASQDLTASAQSLRSFFRLIREKRISH